MREIKFRAWHNLQKKMYDMTDYGFCVRWDKARLSEGFGLISANESKDLEVMQSTGLKDKNGVEIYEGDIVSNPRLRKGGISTVEATELGGWAPFEYDGGGNEYPDDVEVIGNIFESPELLNAKA